MVSSNSTQCPCTPNKHYMACCGRFITSGAIPATPEELMRSRYSAFATANMGYIVATMKQPAADGFDPITTETWARANNWLRLEVLATSLVNETKGYVSFIAHFKRDGVESTIEETSEFRKDNGKWFYVDGEGPRRRNRLTK